MSKANASDSATNSGSLLLRMERQDHSVLSQNDIIYMWCHSTRKHQTMLMANVAPAKNLVIQKLDHRCMISFSSGAHFVVHAIPVMLITGSDQVLACCRHRGQHLVKIWIKAIGYAIGILHKLFHII